MKSQDLQQLELPDGPGIYKFIGVDSEVLYIGKATSLRSRVRSYFSADLAHTRGRHIVDMVEMAKTVKYEATDSVLEALILEARSIKKETPRFNTKEKDDKSFNYVVVTKEAYPRVLFVRGKELFDPAHTPKYEIRYSFGPFPRGALLKDAMKIVRKIFPFRDKCTPPSEGGKGKPCFNRQLGLCPGVCTGEVSQGEYAKMIRHLRMFFEGKKGALMRSLRREMDTAARKLDFEYAGEIKKQIFALEHIQDVALIKDDDLRKPLGVRIESYDVAHMAGRSLVGVMCVVSGGEAEKNEYRKFKIKTFEGIDDTRALRELLDRRLGHTEWELPRLIVVDGGKAQKNAAERLLREYGLEIPVVGVVKDEKHRPKGVIGKKDLIRMHERDILLANSEAHRFAIRYHRALEKRTMRK